MDARRSFDRETLVQRNSDLIGATVDGELVIMSVEHGLYYGLGGVGPRVLELIEQPRNFGSLVDQILDEFDVEREVCEKDMVKFLGQMEDLGLVERR